MILSKNDVIQNKKIWQISREYAGIAEAGGVKNVCCSLAEGLIKKGFEVTHFIPLYGCTNLINIQDFDIFSELEYCFKFKNKKYRVNYAHGYNNGVRIIFIINSQFTQKNGVYTYTILDETLNNHHKKGNGHEDSVLLDLMFQMAVLYYSLKTNDKSDIIHCQDAATSFIPFFARKIDIFKNHFSDVNFVVTIHNAGNGYHHSITLETAKEITHLETKDLKGGILKDKVEPYLLSEPYATLSTVSPWYADEIMDSQNETTGGLSKEFAKRKTHIIGITNGIDYEKYNPTETHKSLLDFTYNPEKDDLEGKLKIREKFIKYYSVKHETIRSIIKNSDFIEQYGFLEYDADAVYFAFQGRMVEQKGIDVIEGAAKIVLEKFSKCRFIITGQGSSALENKCIKLASHYPGKFLYLKGYERSIARQCIAVADFILLPSYFEPCCLEDFIAQIYGTIPIAHAAGGLCKIIDGKTGFLYKDNVPEKLATIIMTLFKNKKKDSQKFLNISRYAAMYIHKMYSWDKVIESCYIPLYFDLEKKG
ncbi:MAG: hypothetical protein BKP49_01795 [Treponema sp. CETP13]|nr:MAG: hypothetical protein BKP49_01795 [Treponema sp. CETP13]